MKIDPEGKAELERLLLGMHEPGLLKKATIRESGETATVQIANKYYRYRLSETAKKILQGQTAHWMTVSDLFTLIEETNN